MSKLVGTHNYGNDISFNVKDTDFLLKLMMRSSFDGNELEVAHSVLQKLAELHKKHLES